MLAFAFVVLILIILGVAFLNGKGGFLIAGYNTMSPQEKAQWNERTLCQATGILLLLFAGCFSIVGLSILFHNYILLTVSIILILAVAFGGIIYINTSKKIKRK